MPGTTNRGRKKTISLEQNALLGTAHNANGRGAAPGPLSSGSSTGGGDRDGRTGAGDTADGQSAKRSRLVSS